MTCFPNTKDNNFRIRLPGILGLTTRKVFTLPPTHRLTRAWVPRHSFRLHLELTFDPFTVTRTLNPRCTHLHADKYSKKLLVLKSLEVKRNTNFGLLTDISRQVESFIPPPHPMLWGDIYFLAHHAEIKLKYLSNIFISASSGYN